MDEDANTFPLDFYLDDPSPHPWKFRPEGYLVVILSDAEEARRAEAELLTGGFEQRDIKVYAGKQILENYEVYVSRRTVTDKVVGSIVDDSEGRDLYLEYAREDRSALWLRMPEDDDARKALRVLADRNYLHARYYGAEKQTDFHVSDPEIR